MALLFFVNGVVVGSWLPRLPEIRDRLGIDLGALGLTLALGGLGSLVGSSLSGLVVGRFGARRTAVVAGAAVYFVLPLIAIAPVAVVLALVLAGIGFIDAQADVGMNAVGVRVEEAVGRSVMTRLHGLWSLGTLIGSGCERTGRPGRPRSWTTTPDRLRDRRGIGSIRRAPDPGCGTSSSRGTSGRAGSPSG